MSSSMMHISFIISQSLMLNRQQCNTGFERLSCKCNIAADFFQREEWTTGAVSWTERWLGKPGLAVPFPSFRVGETSGCGDPLYKMEPQGRVLAPGSDWRELSTTSSPPNPAATTAAAAACTAAFKVSWGWFFRKFMFTCCFALQLQFSWGMQVEDDIMLRLWWT